MSVCMDVCVRVRVCARACACVRVCAWCVRACFFFDVQLLRLKLFLWCEGPCVRACVRVCRCVGGMGGCKCACALQSLLLA